MKKINVRSGYLRRWLHVFLSIVMLFSLSACGKNGETKQEESSQSEENIQVSEEGGKESEEVPSDAPEIEGLTFESKMNLSYAEGFDVYYYKGGYALLRVYDSADYLVVPEGAKVPDVTGTDYVLLQQPLDTMYLAATSAMALFDAMDAMDFIHFSGTQASGWYVENAVTKMNNGEILFAGKYDEPDYELLVDENCDLAIESTMISHSPKVQEMLEKLDIPVFVDRSSYEGHPLGRTEWIKAYSVLVDKEPEAEAFFEEQASVMDELQEVEDRDLKVAYFYIHSNGMAVVPSSSDYIARMIELAGGSYAFADSIKEGEERASVSLTMEEFYAAARDADYLIYNGTIDTPLQSTEDLIAKNELFSDFKAVKEGNVWTTGRDLYQSTDIVGRMILDINRILTGGSSSDMTFLKKVD